MVICFSAGTWGRVWIQLCGELRGHWGEAGRLQVTVDNMENVERVTGNYYLR